MEEMWSDVLTKPLQGAKFLFMWAKLMNCSIDSHEPDGSLIGENISLAH